MSRSSRTRGSKRYAHKQPGFDVAGCETRAAPSMKDVKCSVHPKCQSAPPDLASRGCTEKSMKKNTQSRQHHEHQAAIHTMLSVLDEAAGVLRIKNVWRKTHAKFAPVGQFEHDDTRELFQLLQNEADAYRRWCNNHHL